MFSHNIINMNMNKLQKTDMFNPNMCPSAVLGFLEWLAEIGPRLDWLTQSFVTFDKLASSIYVYVYMQYAYMLRTYLLLVYIRIKQKPVCPLSMSMQSSQAKTIWFGEWFVTHDLKQGSLVTSSGLLQPTHVFNACRCCCLSWELTRIELI